MIRNLHFTSRKNIVKKTQTNKITRLPDTNILESTWEYKISNNNNKYICNKGNFLLHKRKFLIKFGFTIQQFTIKATFSATESASFAAEYLINAYALS